MTEKLSDTHDFKPDYQILELSDRASWKDARAHYRRLVHLWHPDKYTSRPREQVHAKQQFIALAKSFDNLKVFHRENDRLPFEPTAPQYESGHKGKPSDRNVRHSHQHSERSNDVHRGVLGRESGFDASYSTEANGKAIWIAAGCAMLFTTMLVFFMLDRKANQEAFERGKEVVKHAPPSDFMPSAAEIRRSEARGAFVQPTK